jgi:hypothetical protein
MWRGRLAREDQEPAGNGGLFAWLRCAHVHTTASHAALHEMPQGQTFRLSRFQSCSPPRQPVTSITAS